MPLKYTQEDVNVRLHVQLGLCISVGLYDKPIDRENVAAHVDELLAAAGGSREFIDKVTIFDVHLDDDTTLVQES